MPFMTGVKVINLRRDLNEEKCNEMNKDFVHLMKENFSEKVGQIQKNETAFR